MCPSLTQKMSSIENPKLGSRKVWKVVARERAMRQDASGQWLIWKQWWLKDSGAGSWKPKRNPKWWHWTFTALAKESGGWEILKGLTENSFPHWMPRPGSESQKTPQEGGTGRSLPRCPPQNVLSLGNKKFSTLEITTHLYVHYNKFLGSSGEQKRIY